MDKKTKQDSPRYATAAELCEALSIKDRRCLDKWGIKKVTFSKKCVRYDVADFLAKLDNRTTNLSQFELKQRRRKKPKTKDYELTDAKYIARKRLEQYFADYPPEYSTADHLMPADFDTDEKQ